MKLNKILITLLLVFLTIGAVSAADNITSDVPADDAVPQTTDNVTVSSDSNQNPVNTAEKLNASYQITVDGDYVENSGYESEFEIEMFEREFLNGKLEIYIDDELKYSCKPAIDYDSRYQDSWESDEYMNSYSIVDTNFLDRLGLTYGPHKAEFKYSGDTLFNDFNEVRYFNYTYIRFWVPEYETEYESEWEFCVQSDVATGQLKIVLDNRTIHDEEFTGYEYITLENVTFGIHTYDIYYTGNGNFESIHKYGSFKRNYEMDAYFPDEYYEGEVFINGAFLKINLPKDAKSNVTVAVNNKTYSATVSNGQAEIALTNLKLGENIVYITYEDEKYSEMTVVKNITATGLQFPYYYLYNRYDKDANVTLTMPEDANGTLKIKIDGEYFTSDLINGTAFIPLDMVTAGTHNFEITYTGDYSEYFNNKTFEDINIYEVTRDWDMEFFFSIKSDENGNPHISLKFYKPEDLGGTQTLYFDDVKCGEYSLYDEYYYDEEYVLLEKCENLEKYYSQLSNGTHTFTVRYSGDKTYLAKSKTVTFTKPIGCEICTGPLIEIGDKVIVELPECENGTLIITVNDNAKKITLKNKTYYSYSLNLKEGLWNINVTYNGNNMTKSLEKTIDKRPSIDLTCGEYYFKNIPKTAYINYDESSVLKHVTVYIDNKKYTGSIAYGEISLNKLSPGKHTILVKYKNGKYTESIKKKFTILSYSYPKIELKDTYSQELNSYLLTDIALSNDTTLIMDVNLNGNINGKVTVYKTIAYHFNIDDIADTVIGTYKSFSINKGKARISIPTKIFNNTYSLKLEIKLNDGNVINRSYMTHWYPKVVHPAKMTYGEKQTLTIYVPGQENRTIGMFGNFKPMYSKIVNGTAKFSLATLPIRNGVPVTFIYASNEHDEDIGYYSSKLEEYDLKLNIKDSFEKINMYYNDGTSYSLKVAKIYGKDVKKGQTVTFKIGSQTIKVKTDKNGVAKLKIPNTVKPGTYTLTATYKSCKISKKLTVKQVLTLKAVKVKKSAKKLVLTATLKNKKVIKNKQVTFKFNGKTYKAKTNSKGIAKVTIPKSVLTKLKAGKKITYQATYLKNTVKKTVKVQK